MNKNLIVMMPALLLLSCGGVAKPVTPQTRAEPVQAPAAAGGVPVAVYGLKKTLWVGLKTEEQEELWVATLEKKLEAAGFTIVHPYVNPAARPELWIRIHLDSPMVGDRLRAQLEVRHYDDEWDTGEGLEERYYTRLQECGELGEPDPKIPQEKWDAMFAEACLTVLVDRLVDSKALAWHLANLPGARARAQHSPRGLAFSVPGMGGDEMKMQARGAPVVAMRGATAGEKQKGGAVAEESGTIAAGATLAIFALQPKGQADETLLKVIEPVVAAQLSGTCLARVGGEALAAAAEAAGHSLATCDNDLCWSEIAAGAGARYYLAGSLAGAGEKYLLNLRLMDAQSGEVLAAAGDPATAETLVESAKHSAAKLAGSIACE